MLALSHKCLSLGHILRFTTRSCWLSPTSVCHLGTSFDLQPARLRGQQHGWGEFLVSSSQKKRVWCRTEIKESAEYKFRRRASPFLTLKLRQCCSGVVLSHRSKLLISITGRNMSFTGPSVAASAGRTVRRTFDFGRTYVVRPKGKHQATIVWLHGLGDNGNSWSSLLETVPLPNIKWICPTAPQLPVTLFGGFPSTAWFDVNDLSENAHDDIEGLEASATHVASLLANEPADIKLGVGGFSMGAATALYSATCFTRGKFENGNQFSPNLSAVVGLSGWLPCTKTLSNKLEGIDEAAGRAASLPILLCHGKGDDVVAHKFGEKSAEKLSSTGFQDLTFKSYATLGHYTIPEEMDQVCAWLTTKLGLEGTK